MSEPLPTSRPVPVAAISAILVTYLGLNALCLFAPFIPDIEVLSYWGLIFPVIAVLQTWLWFIRSGRKCGQGLAAAIVLTIIFACAGLATFGVCVGIYQSI